MALFEGYERRIKQITPFLAKMEFPRWRKPKKYASRKALMSEK